MNKQNVLFVQQAEETFAVKIQYLFISNVVYEYIAFQLQEVTKS